MFFKGAVWDILSKRPTVLSENEKGLWVLSVYDSYIERILMGKVPKEYFDGEGLKVINGRDLTVRWLEDNIKTMDFFSTNTSYIVLLASEMNKSVSDYLINEDIDWGERFFILSLGSESALTKKLEKKNCHGVVIEPPKFWEGQKLLQFLCSEMKVSLPYDVQAHIADSVPNEPGPFIQCLKSIKLLHAGGGQPSLTQVKNIIDKGKIDQFKIANLYGEKRWNDLFQEILDHISDFDGLVSLFRFLQGHFIKLADISYMNKKSRLTKYDKSVKAQSGLWTAEEISEELAFISCCETWSKTKSAQLVNEVRLRLVKSYY